jgi:hypothetical protein
MANGNKYLWITVVSPLSWFFSNELGEEPLMHYCLCCDSRR